MPAYSAITSSKHDFDEEFNHIENATTTPRTPNDQHTHDSTPCDHDKPKDAPPSAAELENVEPETQQRMSKTAFDLSGSWTWEAGAAALSVVSFALLICFLIKVDGTSYENWQYTISPNAIISTIVTITKVALLVPVSACLSQLKWNQYSNRTPLYHLQVMDQASRGTLGALQMLWTGVRGLRMGSLTFIGAIIMVLALAIDPFAQQILVFLPRRVQSANETASIQVVRHYDSSHHPWDVITQTGLQPSIQNSILSGLAQSNTPLGPQCSSGNCDYPTYVTLGICSNCEDVSNKTKQTCQGKVSVSDTRIPSCTYITPGGFQVDVAGEVVAAVMSDLPQRSLWYLDYWSSNPNYSDISSDTSRPIVSLVAVNQTFYAYYTPSNSTAPPPMPSITECTVYYCEREYPSSSYLAHNNPTYSIHVSRTQWLIHRIHDEGYTIYLEPPNGSEPLSKNSSYSIDYPTFISLEGVLNNMLTITNSMGNSSTSPGTVTLIDILRNGDIGQRLDSMSVSITDAIRLNAGDKNSTVFGEAFKVETFINVRWPWITLLICPILGSTFSLLGTALASKRQNAILWKCSIIPLVISRLETTIPEHGDLVSIRHVDEVEHISKEIEVKMCHDRPLVFIED